MWWNLVETRHRVGFVNDASAIGQKQAVKCEIFRAVADFIEVKDATFEDGLLQIDLARELPEAMKPKRIEIRSGAVAQDNQSKTIEHMRAAS
jgi:hypothetical protein